jgi:hypothetical protein
VLTDPEFNTARDRITAAMADDHQRHGPEYTIGYLEAFIVDAGLTDQLVVQIERRKAKAA